MHLCFIQQSSSYKATKKQALIKLQERLSEKVNPHTKSPQTNLNCHRQSPETETASDIPSIQDAIRSSFPQKAQG